MRILPRSQRKDIYEIYSFCRQVDDIADSSASRASRLDSLEKWRISIASLYAGNASPALDALAHVIHQFSLQKDDFIAVIDGMEMDVTDAIIAPDRSTLDLYCDRVACSVGRLLVKILGIPADDGYQLANHLGRALQLTNILRDIDEDAEMGRVYLPRPILIGAGIMNPTPSVIRGASIDRACASLITDARMHFVQASAIMARHPRHMVIAPQIMAHTYYALFSKLVRRGFDAPRASVRLSRVRLMLTIARYWLLS
ncbi:squalene/phytoene synthase family protein [Candidatus Vallotiella sp. (ex Adelges kitamiensis)]|uniref:squalene/phytoene synthase family protein n=1 Tax=Candidatus Vallotiella sp. (ex Adelges kitamiensis) TaxID=2864217 RepID=UPI001EF0ADA8|nr:squalene/phytoene synthase family protein [Candidatus Vallotia sp. (ex Adelges kitamiensis)]